MILFQSNTLSWYNQIFYFFYFVFVLSISERPKTFKMQVSIIPPFDVMQQCTFPVGLILSDFIGVPFIKYRTYHSSVKKTKKLMD